VYTLYTNRRPFHSYPIYRETTGKLQPTLLELFTTESGWNWSGQATGMVPLKGRIETLLEKADDRGDWRYRKAGKILEMCFRDPVYAQRTGLLVTAAERSRNHKRSVLCCMPLRDRKSVWPFHGTI